jgi:nucleotide-binding universal stress UspA family protein
MAWLSRILAPVAFSPGCRGAVQYAETLACHFHSELTLLHVVAPPVGFFTALEAPAYSVMEEMSQEMLEQRKLELEKYLAPACPHVSLARQVVIAIRRMRSSAARAISAPS